MVVRQQLSPYPRDVITTRQIRAARALIGWRGIDLAKKAEISEATLRNIERGAADPRASTLTKIQQALEKANVVFIDAGDRGDRGDGEGVRLKKPRPPR